MSYLCQNKFRGLFGCYDCKYCRRDRKIAKSTRAQLEQLTHKSAAFVTLTYDDENVPLDGCVNRRDVQLFMKKFRRKHEPKKLRIYGCAEYGEENLRPHYHIIVFGAEPCWYFSRDWKCKCPPCTILRDCWGKGATTNDPVEAGCTDYVSKYVFKNRERVRFIKSLGLTKEFPIYSNRPGIGALAVPELALVVNSNREYLHDERGDVPFKLKFGKKTVRLDKYMRDKLRLECGDIDVQKENAKMSSLQESHDEVEALKEEKGIHWYEAKKIIEDEKKRLRQEKRLQIDTLDKIFAKKGKL